VYGENEGEASSAVRSPPTRTCRDHHAEGGRGISPHHRRQYNLAAQLIEDNRDKVEAMARALLEWRRSFDQINDIMEGPRRVRRNLRVHRHAPSSQGKRRRPLDRHAGTRSVQPVRVRREG